MAEQKNDVVDPLNILSLFSGVGMFDIGVELGFEHLGYRTNVLGYVEREAFPASRLLERMEESALEPAPVWCGNVEDLSGDALPKNVDIVTAGFPCPPVSCAGKREGIDDERWLWPEVMRIIREVRPRWVVLENVRGLLSANDGAATTAILSDLAVSGFDAEWTVLAASEVGASHRRERVFIVADSQSERLRETGSGAKRRGLFADAKSVVEDAKSVGRRTRSRDSGSVREPEKASAQLANSESDRWNEGRTESAEQRREADADWCSGSVGDSVGERVEGKQCKCGNAKGRQESHGSTVLPSGVGVFAPGPSDFDGWGRVVADGSFDFRSPSVKPGVRVLVDGVALVVDASRADQLRASGNGVVPLQSAAATFGLMRRLND